MALLKKKYLPAIWLDVHFAYLQYFLSFAQAQISMRRWKQFVNSDVQMS